MALIPVKKVAMPLGIGIKFPCQNQDHLCTYINKHNACIPILLTKDGLLIREAHSYLYEKHMQSKGMSSFKTIKTYSECLYHWFEYCSLKRLEWKESSVRSVIAYRNSMKASSGEIEKSLKPATINLRTTVVVEFLKFYLNSKPENDSLRSLKAMNSSELARARLSLRGKYSRPIALSVESCKKLSAKLKGTHRIVFIWAVSTGLRVSSLLSISKKDFSSLADANSGGFIEVLAKGGKWLKVYLTEYVISETRRYIAVERRLLELRRKAGKSATEDKLFINQNGATLSYDCYYAAYKRGCNSLGIKSNPHQTRTTFATFMEKSLRAYAKESGVDHIKIIQGLLGHSSVNTTVMYLESLNVYDIDILNILEGNSRRLGGTNA
ncbi:tyrosine-type recombinase/integrase [Pseudomonas sp. LD120]|uniref:tyrosine-type recombinase/integrase n=1 Tax=Pseudomonas sp. LD120 TaxID=485751 RepID=UPI00135C20AA|nr:tyrosine-type recombinase/integrase [Pseudomonas sp. LD120]KAF0862201.1 tyrosine-type recombinase/integrase [Pseudomonas sp. LD120]